MAIYNTTRIVAGASGTLDKPAITYNTITLRVRDSTAYDSTGKKNFDNDGFEQTMQASLNYKLNTSLTAKAFGISVFTVPVTCRAFIDDKDYTAKNSNKLGGLSCNTKVKILSEHTRRLQRAERTFTNEHGYQQHLQQHSEGKYTGNTTTWKL